MPDPCSLSRLHCLLLRGGLLWILLLGLGACASLPPVQEMSDARQAIAAAREAGAETLDPTTLARAEVLLSEAQGRLARQLYWEASRLATAAKESAVAALLRSREVKASVAP